jgi:peroxiredoxin Q/BCP
MLKVGDRVPEFKLASANGEVSSKDMKGRRYVLYFYPKDDTPGCTVEACEFRDNLPKFEQVDVPVFGVSADDMKSHEKFAKKHGLNFTLLADPERTLIEPLGLWVEKSMYGKKYMGVQRSTFVVDENGRIAQVWEKVKPEGHAEEVLQWLSGAPSDPAPPAKKPAKKKSHHQAQQQNLRFLKNLRFFTFRCNSPPAQLQFARGAKAICR